MGLAERVSIPVFVTVSMTGARRRLLVKIEGRAAPKDDEICLVAYDDSHTTPITRGENAGKTLWDTTSFPIFDTWASGKARR